MGIFAALIVAGFALAGGGSAAAAIVGMAAWTALLVHSFADHLLEFVPVTLAAGLVLGWAGTSPKVPDPTVASLPESVS